MVHHYIVIKRTIVGLTQCLSMVGLTYSMLKFLPWSQWIGCLVFPSLCLSELDWTGPGVQNYQKNKTFKYLNTNITAKKLYELIHTNLNHLNFKCGQKIAKFSIWIMLICNIFSLKQQRHTLLRQYIKISSITFFPTLTIFIP